MRVDTFFSTAVNNISEVVKDGSADTWTHSINSLEPQYLRPIFVRGWNFTENNLTKEDITPWDANMVFVSVFCRRRFEIIKIPRATAETPGRVKHTTENLRETQTDTFPVWDSSDLENWRWFLNFAFSTPW